MLDAVSYDKFSAQLNTKFRLAETTIELKLIEVNKLKTAPAQEAFSLIFLGPKDLMLMQQTYVLAHDALGAGMLFLVPVEQSDAGIKYEAIFNHLLETEN